VLEQMPAGALASIDDVLETDGEARIAAKAQVAARRKNSIQ